MPETDEHVDILDQLRKDLEQIQAVKSEIVRIAPAQLASLMSDAITEIRTLRTKLAAETAAYESASDMLGRARDRYEVITRALAHGITTIEYVLHGTITSQGTYKILELNRQRMLKALNPETIEGVDDGWRPMETAPRDGTRFYAYEKSDDMCTYECWWQDDVSEWEGWRNDWDNEPHPTHWRPLFAPPDSVDTPQSSTGLQPAPDPAETLQYPDNAPETGAHPAPETEPGTAERDQPKGA